MISRRKVLPVRRSATDGGTASVVRDRCRHANRMESCLARAKAQIDIFKGEEIFLVEQTDALEHRAPDQHDAAADRIDRAPRTNGSSVERPSSIMMAHPP